MPSMRCHLTHIAILASTCFLAGKPSIHAQSTVSTAVPDTQNERSCPASSSSDDDEPSGPEISIAEVTFSGAVQMPSSDQEEIAASIKQRTHGNSLADVTDEALERARAGWQNEGYFTAQVSGEARELASSPSIQRIALSIHVDEGLQYRLGEITFKHNKAIGDVDVLRRFFAINKGDILNREKIAKGLESLRIAYAELGFINFTSIPNTEIDDGLRLISIDVNFDEGRQYHLGGVKIVGLDEPTGRELLKNFPMKRGQVYNGRLFDSFMDKYVSMFPDGGVDAYARASRALDEHTGTVTFTFDFRPCSGD